MSYFKKNCVYFFLVLAILADLGYSYYQYSSAVLDADLIKIVGPSDTYKIVLEDPIGWKAFYHGESYPGPNRFTAHASLYAYFRTMPFFLQNFVNPIDSIYVAGAIAKTFMHVFFISLLGWFISVLFKSGLKEGIIGAALCTPFFQASGDFAKYMCMIDYSLAYAFFYALPIICFLIFFAPLYKSGIKSSYKIPFWIKSLMVILLILLIFFGPLLAPILIIMSAMAFCIIWYSTFKTLSENSFFLKCLKAIKGINRQLFFLILFTLLLCLYSLYIGTKNSENDWAPMPLLDRYSRLLHGIVDCFFNKDTGVIFLLIGLTINFFLLKYYLKESTKLFFKIVSFIAVFSIIYITLLPMGGYRNYRPLIIRQDTILPVISLLVYCWGVSSIYLLKYFNGLSKALFICFLLGITFFFTKTDTIPTYVNVCEKEKLHQLASLAENKSVPCFMVNRDCTIVNWYFIYTCEQSQLTCFLLDYWNITSRRIEFYQHKKANYPWGVINQ